MTQPTTDPAPETGQQGSGVTPPPAPPATGSSQDSTDDWEGKYQGQLKVNRDLEQKLERERKARMTEDEKVIHEAEQRGRAAANKDNGARLAQTQFEALAARRNPEFKTEGVVELVDLSKVLSDSGEIDKEALARVVNQLVPEPSGRTSLDGGARGTAGTASNMNDVIRQQAGYRR